MAVGTAFHYGQTVPNSPRFPEVEQSSIGFEFNVRPYPKRLFSKRKAEKPDYHPNWVYTLYFQSLGNSEVLGNAIAYAPGYQLPILRKKHFALDLTPSMGVAWLSRPYNSIHNPQNKAVGSHINFFDFLKAEGILRLSRHFALTLGVSVAHYSNGNVRSPNLGVNVPAVAVGVLWFNDPRVFELPQPFESLEPQPSPPALPRKGFVSLHFGTGISEIAFGGPRYPAYHVQLGYSYILNPRQILTGGLEWLLNRATYRYMKHTGQEQDKELAQSQRLAIFVSHEWVHRGWGFFTEGGIYLNPHFGQRSLFSSKIGWRKYAFKHRLYIGLQTRAYFGEADLSEVVLGCRL